MFQNVSYCTIVFTVAALKTKYGIPNLRIDCSKFVDKLGSKSTFIIWDLECILSGYISRNKETHRVGN